MWNGARNLRSVPVLASEYRRFFVSVGSSVYTVWLWLSVQSWCHAARIEKRVRIERGKNPLWSCLTQVESGLARELREFLRLISNFNMLSNLIALAKYRRLQLTRPSFPSGFLESTGIYWISLYEVLEQYGFEVRVVNAQHVKNVPERTKTDVLDGQWIQKLHSFGLLNGSFRPMSRFANCAPTCVCEIT
jgi:hypothetical protein